MYTSSPLPALCLLVALGCAAPVVNDAEFIDPGIFWDGQATGIEKRDMTGALIPTPAPQPYEVDNYLPRRQSDDIIPGLGGVPGCEYTISPEGQSCKSLPLKYLPTTSSTHIPPQIYIHSHHPISNPQTSLQQHLPTPNILQTATAAAPSSPSPPPGTASTKPNPSPANCHPTPHPPYSCPPVHQPHRHHPLNQRSQSPSKPSHSHLSQRYLFFHPQHPS